MSIIAKILKDSRLLQQIGTGECNRLGIKQPGVTFAHPVGTYQATKKIRKLMDKFGMSYEEAKAIRMKRTGF